MENNSRCRPNVYVVLQYLLYTCNYFLDLLSTVIKYYVRRGWHKKLNCVFAAHTHYYLQLLLLQLIAYSGTDKKMLSFFVHNSDKFWCYNEQNYELNVLQGLNFKL